MKKHYLGVKVYGLKLNGIMNNILFNVTKVFDIDKILKFLEQFVRVVTLSEEYEEKDLNYFSNGLLLNATQVFDIDRIAILLEQFIKTVSPVEQV